jgi:hypothetical protein
MILIILVVVLIFGLPSGWYTHSRTDGNYVYSGGVGLGTVALILLLLFLFGGGLGGFPHYRW